MGKKQIFVVERVLIVYVDREIKELDAEESKLVFKAIKAGHLSGTANQSYEPEQTDADSESAETEDSIVKLSLGKNLWRRLKKWLGRKSKEEDGGLPEAMVSKPKKR